MIKKRKKNVETKPAEWEIKLSETKTNKHYYYLSTTLSAAVSSSCLRYIIRILKKMEDHIFWDL